MDYPTIENVKIKSASISMADHGCLTISLNIEGSGWGCNIGGWCNGIGHLGATLWKGNGSAIVAMMKIMNVVGVSKWEDLNGKFIRVEVPSPGACTISKIGNIIEDEWFDLKAFYETDKGQATFVLDETPSKEEDDWWENEDASADFRGRGGC